MPTAQPQDHAHQCTVSACIEEALTSLREKSVRSATMDRLRLALEADALVQGLPQPLQLSKGLGYILDRIPLPSEPHDLILGRGEHQISSDPRRNTGWARNLAYDYTPYVVIGGRRRDGSPGVNELTELLIEQVVPRFETPDLVVRYTPDVPERTWRALCDKMRQNASIFVYNDASVIPAIERCGIPREVATEYTMRGCNYVALPGSNQTLEHYLFLVNHVRDAIIEAATTARSMEDVYAAAHSRIRGDMDTL